MYFNLELVMRKEYGTTAFNYFGLKQGSRGLVGKISVSFYTNLIVKKDNYPRRQIGSN